MRSTNGDPQHCQDSDRSSRAALQAQSIGLDVTDDALDEIAKVGFDPLFGVPLKRAVQEYIENPVARLLLQGKCAPNDVIAANAVGDKFDFQVRKASE